MRILTSIIPASELKDIAANSFGDMVKAVVDIAREIVAIDAELHSDLEALLLENGSRQCDLWGINLYPDLDESDFLEFDSMINLRPAQGNTTRGVDFPEIQQKISSVVDKWMIR